MTSPHHTGLRSLREQTTSQKGKTDLFHFLLLCWQFCVHVLARTAATFSGPDCLICVGVAVAWHLFLSGTVSCVKAKKKKKIQEKREKTHKHWLWYTNKNNALVWVGEEHSVLFGSAQLSQESVDIFGVHVMQHAAGLPTWQKWKQKQSYFCSSLQELIFTQIYDKRMGDDLLSQSGKSFILQSHCLIRNWIGK